jgi:hypothetical protein
MTRKDFVVISNVLRDARVSGDPSAADLALLDDLCKHFAQELSFTNPNFDRGRFLTACGARA